ncbi:hypothetical protein LTR66_006019 [Elasticomyces elasticus]|nr:hypothetical protein LTR66_006019 [Elasticomyces elasticus]
MPQLSSPLPATLIPRLCYVILPLLCLLLSWQSGTASGYGVGAPNRTCTALANSYDFIIVGGGTAGLALATRLSQSLPYDCILVIEAGPSAPDEPRINIPGLKGSTIGTVYDWNFTTVPQPGARNRVFPATRGKVLGGSSALNLMTWDRASIADYDAWEELGNPGWNWDSMIASMEKSENFVRTNGTYGFNGVGYGGPIQTLVNQYVPSQQLNFIPTMEHLGLDHNLESLGGNPLGVMSQPSNIRWIDYTRSYSPAYLTLAGQNLHIMNGTMVSKIDFQDQCGELVATGVTLAGNTTIRATKEVILSAGTFQSPTLLELSGIGQTSVLSAAGKDCLLDLPGVGENLQDHIRIQNSYQLKPNYTSFDILKYNSTFAAEQLALYKNGERSMYDYTGSGYAYMTWQQALGNHENLTYLAKQAASSTSVVDQKKLSYLTTSLRSVVPQLEVIFSDGYTGVKGYPAKTSDLYGKEFFTLIAGIQHPFSRGSVHINSSNPAGKPVINPNYLGCEYDLQAAIAATKFNRKIASTAPLKDAWIDEYEPGSAVGTEAQWRDFAKNTTLSLYHPVGTCAMLPRNESGVVSPELIVYGTSNLRIVDASVVPILPSAHLQTAVYGIAERAAVMIIEKWGF